MLDQITPLIIAYNEAPNLPRTLAKLAWARRIVVIDSGSTDETGAIARRYAQVAFVEHPFTDFASQCNFGLTQVATPWVLSLDADYELSEALIAELAALAPWPATAGYSAHFIYRIHGRALQGSLYPPRTVLFRKDAARYHQEGHGHRVIVDGEVRPLRGAIYHDDRKPLARWLASHQRYAREEAAYLLSLPRDGLSRADRLRLMGWPAPLAAFVYVLLVKRCVLAGWPGLFYALQRTTAEALLALEIVNHRLTAARCDNAGQSGSAQ